jgi:hypothetical protein
MSQPHPYMHRDLRKDKANPPIGTSPTFKWSYPCPYMHRDLRKDEPAPPLYAQRLEEG